MKFIIALLLSLEVTLVFAGSANYVITEVTATTTSAKILDKDDGRCAFIIQNKGTENVFIKTVTAHTGTEGLLLVPGGNWSPAEPPRDAIFVKAEANTSAVAVADGHCF